MAKKPFLTRMATTLGAVWTFGYKIGPRFLARHSMGHVVPLAEKVRRGACVRSSSELTSAPTFRSSATT